MSFAVGFLFGLAHFGSLWWNARLYAGHGAVLALALQLVRLGLLVLVLATLARLGAAPLVAAASGLLVARLLLVRRLGRLP